jgi:hypothetical protein
MLVIVNDTPFRPTAATLTVRFLAALPPSAAATRSSRRA